MNTNHQRNYGIGNSSESNTVNVYLSNFPTELGNLLERVSKEIEKEDQRINGLLHEKVLINKTGEREPYSTEKILRSLINLGVPLQVSYSIAQATVGKILARLNNPEYRGKHLSTKDIRKMVSESIQELKLPNYSMFDIEIWTNKYARRYGHNNRRVEIYWKDSDITVEVSYDFIDKKLLNDVITEIAKGAEIHTEISQKHRKIMSTEVLNFINHCDLYKIRYDLLKDMIFEIATQPPHPWMLNDEIRETILAYDHDALNENLQIINPYIEKRKPIPQSAGFEILHHASALVLGMHNYFFGCFDLTAFYQLREIISLLMSEDSWNDAIQSTKLSKLLTDISFAGVDIYQFKVLLDEIASGIKNQKLETEKFANNILGFGNMARKIFLFGNYDKISAIMQSDWNDQPSASMVFALKSLLYSVFPARKYNLDYSNNYFWISYKYVYLKSFPKNEFLSQFFVIYAPSEEVEIDYLDVLCNAKTQRYCNTILLIAESNEKIALLKSRITDFLMNLGIDSHYQLICLSKESVLSLLHSSDKVSWFDQQLVDQTTLD